jgi:hypothetical protein
MSGITNSDEIVDYVNTTSSVATEIIADNGITGFGVVALEEGVPPFGNFLIADDGSFIITLSGENIIT